MTKKSSRVALQCSIDLTNAFRTLPERSRGLLESSLKPSAVSFCTSSRGFTRTCARERTLCATSLRLSQQPARGLLESSLEPSAVPFCRSSRAFMRICARQRTSCAHSLSNLLAVLIPEKICNTSRALMRIHARCRTSYATSLSNLLAVLIPEKFCNPSRQPFLSNFFRGAAVSRSVLNIDYMQYVVYSIQYTVYSM